MTTEAKQHGLLHRQALECLCGAFLYEDRHGLYCVDSHERLEIPWRRPDQNAKGRA